VGGFWHVFQEIQHGGQLDWGLLIALVLPLIPVLLLLGLAAMLIELILRDGMMPHFALDDASAGEAWFQVWSRIKAEKQQFFVYALLRVALPIIAAIGLFFLLAIPAIGAPFLVGFLLGATAAVVTIVIAVLYLIALAVVNAALNGIFVAALYQYTQNKQACGPFTPQLLNSAWHPR